MSRIKFYSVNDIASVWELGMIVNKVKSNDIDSIWEITDVLDFHNILKYINIEWFSDYIIQETRIDITSYKKKIEANIARFVNYHKENFINLYNKVDIERKDDFFEILVKYKLYKAIDVTNFSLLIDKEDIHIYLILKFKKLTEYFDEVVKDKLLSDSNNVNIILSKFLKEDDIYLPPSLSDNDILNLINEYIDSPLVDYNVLIKVVNFPPNTELKINDKTKLRANRRAEKEEEEILKGGTVGIVSGVRISYLKNQEEVFIKQDNTIDVHVSQNWIEDNLDYPTLWNNFIYLFDFVDEKMILELVSKKSEIGSFESIFRNKASYMYYTSTAFKFKELGSNIVIQSYYGILKDKGIRFEEMIEWFFNVYLKEEFQISNFIVKMPSSDTTYFEKCRTILPEIDRIFKQYNVLIEEGMIDQELIQMSSSSFKSKDINSFNKKKYVYSSSEWYQTASFLLFSDQSSIFYLPNKEEKFKNFVHLKTSKKLTKSDFRDYQLERIQWLIDNNLICENNMGQIEFVDQKVINVLKELYFKEVISYWHYPEDIREIIEELSNKNIIELESRLFTRNEQDYLDYYLNKSKFTNGHDIRNKYLHGTNANNEEQYRLDYYIILKLFVIIVLKINDDLCIKEDGNQ